jgi:hypothetical protein
MEAGWLRRMQECRLYAYRLPAGPFRPHKVEGYWVAGEQVDAIDQVIIDDLARRHASAGIELRVAHPQSSPAGASRRCRSWPELRHRPDTGRVS